MRESSGRQELVGGFRSLALSPAQQREADKLVNSDKPADAALIASVADKLLTQDRYQTAFRSAWDLIDARTPRWSPFDKTVWSSFLAAESIIESHYQPGQRFNLQFNSLAEGRLAALAVTSHPQLRNMPLPAMRHEFVRLAHSAGLAVASRPSSIQPSALFLAHLQSLEGAKFAQQSLVEIEVNERKESRFVNPLASDNDELFDRLRRLQKYGVKPVYASDGSCLPVVDWHIYDVSQLCRKLGADSANGACSIERSLVRFDGFKERLADQPPAWDLVCDNKQEFVVVQYQGLDGGQKKQISPSVCFDIWPCGHLYSPGGFSLAGLAAQLGLEAQYEVLRARALSLYADLVVPFYIVDDSEEIRQSENRSAQNPKFKVRSFGDIVLARRRLIDQHPDLPKLIAKEAKKHRPVQPHDVASFFRKLPSGQTASQKQRDLCWEELKVYLPPGYTFVGGFERGGEKTEDSDGLGVHRARLRYVASVALEEFAAQEQKPPAKPSISLELP